MTIFTIWLTIFLFWLCWRDSQKLTFGQSNYECDQPFFKFGHWALTKNNFLVIKMLNLVAILTNWLQMFKNDCQQWKLIQNCPNITSTASTQQRLAVLALASTKLGIN